MVPSVACDTKQQTLAIAVDQDMRYDLFGSLINRDTLLTTMVQILSWIALRATADW